MIECAFALHDSEDNIVDVADAIGVLLAAVIRHCEKRGEWRRAPRGFV